MTTLEIIKITNAMEDDTYYGIINTLALEDEEGYPLHSVEEIAEMYNVSVEVVQYIDRAENDIF